MPYLKNGEIVKKILLCDELQKIINKINNNENFMLMRYGDGERSLILGKEISAQEGWKAPNEITNLGIALKNSLSLEDDNVYYGISCPCCDREAYYWYSSNIKNKNKTFANIFVNKNYFSFINEFEKIKRKAIVIGNKNGIDKKIGNLDVIQFYPVSDDCVDFWDKKARGLIKDIVNKYGKENNLLYVFSAGPLSEPIMYELYKNNSNNCYIDFGSSIDKYIHGKDTRPYTNKKSDFGKRNCWMFDPYETDFNVSVVLTTYKKPDALKKQLEALKNQTLTPNEIMLYQDGINGNYKIEFEDNFLKEFDKKFLSSKNNGVWERFKFAKNASNFFVCIFDDDTIPGRRWLENCHYHMVQEEGVYGTVGIVLQNYKKYPYGGFYRIGWHRPYTKKARVDFIGHSWFIKKEYLNYMLEDTEEYQKYKYCAEDMCLSYKCQLMGIYSFVPPHPYFDKDLWGSLPESGMKYGNDSVAISQNYDNCMVMREALSSMVHSGWKLYKDERRNLVILNDLAIRYEYIKSIVKKVLIKITKL